MDSHLSGEVVLYDGEDGESLETGRQVQDEQIIVVLRHFIGQKFYCDVLPPSAWSCCPPPAGAATATAPV